MEPEFYHASLGFPSKNSLSGRAWLCYKSAPSPSKKEGGFMIRKSALFAAAACAALLVAGCATEPEKPKPAAPAPAPAPAPRAADVKPAPPPAPKKPAVISLSSTELFEFNKATLTQEARGKLDAEVIGKLRDFGEIRYVNVNGHADRLGTPQYNQKLSEQRAEAVRAYIVSKGADAAKVEVFGFGKTLPVKSCPDEKMRAELIACLAPNRRVVVEVQGSPR
jgi:OmpA-OmpF porin, OOP family